MGVEVAPVDSCRVCSGADLVEVIDLGQIAVSDFNEGGTPDLSPLTLVMCNPAHGCGFVQQAYSGIDPYRLYGHYWYRSGVNEVMVEALQDIVRSAVKFVDLRSRDVVLDIGCNDGTLLSQYPDLDLAKVGFDPALNVSSSVDRTEVELVSDLFSRDLYFSLPQISRAKIVTSIAMFYDVDDPNQFFGDVAAVLDDDGVWVVQMSYLASMLETAGFDNICHEHVGYYSLAVMERLANRHGLRVVDVELNEVNGGSFRVFLCKSDSAVLNRISHAAQARLNTLRDFESRAGVGDLATYKAFDLRVKKVREALIKFIDSEIDDGKTFHVYGASTKGNTLLQYFGLDRRCIDAASERSPEKWGLSTVATGIPIISEDESRKLNPGYYLVLPWHFREHFIRREHHYLSEGGGMVFPLPEPEVVRLRGGAVETRRIEAAH